MEGNRLELTLIMVLHAHQLQRNEGAFYLNEAIAPPASCTAKITPCSSGFSILVQLMGVSGITSKFRTRAFEM